MHRAPGSAQHTRHSARPLMTLSRAHRAAGTCRAQMQLKTRQDSCEFRDADRCQRAAPKRLRLMYGFAATHVHAATRCGGGLGLRAPRVGRQALRSLAQHAACALTGGRAQTRCALRAHGIDTGTCTGGAQCRPFQTRAAKAPHAPGRVCNTPTRPKPATHTRIPHGSAPAQWTLPLTLSRTLNPDLKSEETAVHRERGKGSVREGRRRGVGTPAGLYRCSCRAAARRAHVLARRGQNAAGGTTTARTDAQAPRRAAASKSALVSQPPLAPQASLSPRPKRATS